MSCMEEKFWGAREFAFSANCRTVNPGVPAQNTVPLVLSLSRRICEDNQPFAVPTCKQTTRLLAASSVLRARTYAPAHAHMPPVLCSDQI